jgi:hypothetical protein
MDGRKSKKKTVPEIRRVFVSDRDAAQVVKALISAHTRP